MKHLFFIPLIGLISIGSAVFAQNTGKVDVIIIDQQQKPLGEIFIELVRAKDSTMVQYTVSGQDGAAEFSNVAKGRYAIYVAQTGFKNYFSSPFIIDSIHPLVTLPAIRLQANSLNEVVVMGKTPVIQHYADKTVVNVEQSPLNAVGSAYDVLQHSPGVLIDQNDNISLHGKSNVMVMIDGRITPMSSTDLANLLKGMPAESIEKIEFITNPSAKYDANGTAGIINIILKKNKYVGTHVSINAGYSQGIYPKSNDGFSISKRTKKFNLFANYNYSYRGAANAVTLQSNYYTNAQLASATLQNEYLRTPVQTNTARIGTDFFASDKTTIGFIADGGTRFFNPSETTTTYVYNGLDALQSYNITNSTNPNTTYNYSGNLNMKHTFDSTGRELLVNIDYANYHSKGYQNILINYYNLDGTSAGSPVNYYGYLPGNLSIYSFKADYDGELGKNSKLETGIKSSYVTTDNSVMVYDGTDASAPVDTTQSNHFIYSENINAGYLTYTKNIHKASVELGMRTEQTIANGDQVTTGQTFAHNIIQLFPNISINDSLTKDNQLGLSASRRIDRPTYDQLNPFRIYVNPTFYLQGNPYLIPQSAYSLQLSDTYKDDYSLSLTYTHTTNAIETVIFPIPGDQNIVQQTEENLATYDYYGASLSIVHQFAKWWDINASADAYLSHYEATLSNSPLNTNRFLFDAFGMNNFTLNKKLSAEVTASYNSGYDLGYLYIQGSWWAAVGVKMSILKSKGTLKLNANDIFWTNTTRGTTTFNTFNQAVFVRRDTRYVGVSFTYSFGRSPSSQSMHSKGGAEEEKKRAGSTS